MICWLLAVYGNPRLCSFDACYYCYECHENQEACIPARVLHNWDFSKYRGELSAEMSPEVSPVQG